MDEALRSNQRSRSMKQSTINKTNNQSSKAVARSRVAQEQSNKTQIKATVSRPYQRGRHSYAFH